VSLVLLPLALVDVAVGVLLLTESVHHALLELSFILAVVWPDHYSLSIRVVVSELTFINLSGVCEVI